MLISVQQAQTLITDAVRRHAQSGTERVSLTAADGRVLAEQIVSQQNVPRFDKALMDGYAVNAAEPATHNEWHYPVKEEITAGSVPTQTLAMGEASRIMTGAQIPAGATAVVPFEQSVFNETVNTVSFPDVTILPDKHILRTGALQQIGGVILEPETVLQPQYIAILAELGHAEPLVYRQPTIAILATGDELVPYNQTPAAGQIRNSNALMLASQVRNAGGKPIMLGIARDEENHLRSLIAEGLQSDILLLSGGVSAGKKDLVPGILTELGVKEIFHKVRLKPGKPCWFGQFSGKESSQNAVHDAFVFGLPGNPVSSFVCFELFVRSVIEMLGHLRCSQWCEQKFARLKQTHIAENDRPTYHPGKLSYHKSGLEVDILPWKGSADLSGLRDADALVCISADPKTYSPGEIVDIIPL